jgi:hypothetical protein
LGPQGPRQKTITTRKTKDLGENSIKNDAPRDAQDREQQKSAEIQDIVDAIMILPEDLKNQLLSKITTR